MEKKVEGRGGSSYTSSWETVDVFGLGCPPSFSKQLPVHMAISARSKSSSCKRRTARVTHLVMELVNGRANAPAR